MKKNKGSSIKEFYQTPKVDVIVFDYTDIIATSGCSGDCPKHSGCTRIDEASFELFNI